ncbi:MAG TPA: efflux RND transporter periplasmic adaptor subunit [Chloroflexota bacterium]|nr:efflux RND transporter periplasmic adaptor subunit [Chloroflexota bacterium]
MVKSASFVRLGSFVVTAFLVIGCSAAGAGGAPPGPGQGGGQRPATIVSVAKVTTGPISETVSYTGSVQASDTVSLSPQISGRVTKLNADVGSQVKAGDVIAELDQTTLQAQVAQAQATLDTAQVKLDQVQAGARPETIQAANANAAIAQSKLTAVQNGPRPETVEQAKANLTTAQQKLAAVQAGPRPETVAQAKANLDAANAKLAQLVDGATQDQIASQRLAIEQSKDALMSAQANRDGVCGNGKGGSFQCNAAQATVNAAQTALDSANQNYKTLTDPPTPDVLAQAQAAVNLAQQAYQLAQHPYTAQDLAQAQAAVDAAQQAYQLAQHPYTSQDVAQAQAAADAAQATAKLSAQPYTDLDVKSAQAGVAQAEAGLAIAKANLAQAILRAPFDGTVSAKLLSVGALAGPSSPIVTLNSNSPQVQFSIDEARIASIKPNQTVNLSSAAYPGKAIPAKIAGIYPSADPKTHTFTVVAVPQGSDSTLLPGMFVSLQVVLRSVQNAVLVPVAAIVQNGSQESVYVVANGQAHKTVVTPGLTDGQNVQIVSGLKAGDEVATSGQTTLSDGAPVRPLDQATSGGTGGAGGNRGGGNAGTRNGAGATGGARPGQQGQGQGPGARPTPTKAGG